MESPSIVAARPISNPPDFTPKSKYRGPEWAIYFASFVATVAIVFWYYHPYLYHPIYQDDIGYFYFDPPLTWRKALNYCNPAWGWYFRPVFNNYVVGMTTLFHRQSVPVHGAGLILTGITVWLLGALGYRLRGIWVGLLAPILFIFAPGKDEAIWWPAAANALLAGCFYCATLLCWTIWRQSGKRRWYALSIVSLVLTLCSKDDAISMPLSMFALDLALKRDMPLAERIKLFAPVAVLTAIYIVCDKIGYEHAVRKNPGAALFAFEPIRRMIILMHFCLKNFIYSYVSSGDVSEFGPLLFLVGIALAAWRLLNKPVLLALLFIALVASIPAPIGTGMHSASERFSFLPALMIALLIASLFMELITSPNQVNRLVAVALAASYLAMKITLRITDPSLVWIELLILIVISVVLWREKLLSGTTLALIVAVLVVSQITYFIDFNDNPGLYVAMMLAAGLAATYRSGFWPGAVIVPAMCDEVMWTLPMFVAGSVVVSMLLKSRSKRLASNQTEIASPDVGTG